MKTILKVTMMFAFIVFANSLFAIGNLKVKIAPVSSEKALVTITSLKDSNLKISVKDENGLIVYYKEVNNQNNEYSKVFDLSNLEDGSYNLSVVSNNLTTERSFQKKKGTIKVGEEKTMIEPFFGYEDGILKCTYLNFSQENLTLYFYDKNELIYTKNIGRNFNVGEALNLSKLGKGNYVAILSTGSKSYSYEINVN